MKTNSAVRFFLSGAFVWAATALQAATYYVSPTGNDSNTGSSSSPFLTIQKGVDKSVAGDLVLVAPGTYATGGKQPSGSCYSRVAIERNLTVRSTHGAAVTVIEGQPHSSTSVFGPNSTRCVYMTAGTLDGFTLRNGFANAIDQSVPFNPDSSKKNGGGVYAPVSSRDPQVNNCIIASCAAYRGGGAYWATLNNCTVVSNYVDSSSTNGDGVWGSLVRNSIVMFNHRENYASGTSSDDVTLFINSCTTPAPGLNFNGFNRDGGNNITNDPSFVAGTLRPNTNSPCINTGNNAYSSGTRDAAGNARIIGEIVDIGAFESTQVFYSLTVNNGSGDGYYSAGAVVPILADPAVPWTRFTGWAGDIATVADTNAASTTLVMLPRSMTVTATYSDMTLPEIIGSVLGLPPPITVSNITVEGISLLPPEVRLGPVGDSDVAFFSTVYTNAGTLIFPWRVSSEEGYDTLSLVINGTNITSISGDVSGVVTQFVGSAGANVIQWIYSKDVSDYDGEDAGWVGAPTWIPDALAAELGTPGKPLGFPYGLPGAALPFPYGFAACYLDAAPPAGAVGGDAVKLGGLSNGTNGFPLVSDSQTTGVEVTLHGAGTLSFQWRPSCQASDYLICTIDGVEAARISGNKTNAWVPFTTNLLTVAAHTVRWSYAKNASGFTALDCGWIDHVVWTQFAYHLTVENGSGSGTYAVGETVAITADAAPAGQEFNTWDGDTETVADLFAPTNSLVMPSRDITVRALYRQKVLSVTVVNGRDAGALPNLVHESTGEPEGSYPAGAYVRIVAATAPLWQIFDHWTSADGAVFADANNPITYFTMPPNSVRIEAVYRAMTASEKLGSALTIAGQALDVTAFSPNGVVAGSAGGVRYDDPVVKFGGASVGPDQSVSLTTTNFTGQGVLLYWWRATAESRYDRIELVVDNTTVISSYSGKGTAWQLSTNWVMAANSLSFRFKRDGTYYVRDNTILVDRVTWIPLEMIDSLGMGCIPDINGEDPGPAGFSGEDGGVAWVADAPSDAGDSDAIRFGRFGYVNNNQHAKLTVVNKGTGVYYWKWASNNEADYDSLDFFVDGSLEHWISGKERAWYTSSYVVTNLPKITRQNNLDLRHEFLFNYEKDSDVSIFEDCAWLHGASWTPTFMLSLSKATATSFAFAAPLGTIPEVWQEAANSIFPLGTLITVQADTPPTGYYFGSWEGGPNLLSVLNPGDLYNPNPTFPMPDFDLVMIATYTTNAPSPGPTPPSSAAPMRITGLAVQPAIVSAQAVQSLRTLAAAAPVNQVVIDVEEPSQVSYDLTWSPDLASPASQWQTLSIQYREVIGDSPNGLHLVRLYVEIPASAPQGFFRIRTR